MPMIEVHDLSKRYRDRVAVDALSFSLDEGQVLGFLGPNGAGKSTTMKMLTGFLPPSEGTAKVAGFDVFEHPMEVRRRIGYLPETPPLYPEMTVRAYLTFVATLKGVPRRSLPSEVERCTEAVGITRESGRVIGNLSKGFKQRVGIAQALLGSPPVLILDEPTEGLDPRQRSEMRALVRSLGLKHTVILSTHLLHEVAATCDRVLIIDQGKMRAFDTIEALSRRDDAAEGSPQTLEQVFIQLTAA